MAGFCALLVMTLVGATLTAETVPRQVHVFVALADNPHDNLYWGAAFGVKTFFGRHADWTRVKSDTSLPEHVLERVVFEHRAGTRLVADAYQGAAIKNAIEDFLKAAAGGDADLVVYVGHDGLMDFQLEALPRKADDRHRDAMILACISKRFFDAPMRATGATPLLWTTGLMAPEAYALAAALDGWIARESGTQVRDRAAAAYHQYQKCGLTGAKRLFATGF